jgi:hypothetical protein
LGLDFLAFDYSYDRRGELVIWEINVLPGLGLPREPNREHLAVSIERAMAATVKMYLVRAGLRVPAKVDEFIRAMPYRTERGPVGVPKVLHFANSPRSARSGTSSV